MHAIAFVIACASASMPSTLPLVLVQQAKKPATKPVQKPAAKPTDVPTSAPEKAIEVPFRLGDDAIIVDAKVNGRKVSLMFDTGFSGWVVCDANINLGKTTGKMTLRDFVGEFEVDTVKINSLTLGDEKIPVKDAEAVMQPGADFSFSYNTHCDGIMGFSVIKDVITEINFERKMFIFHPKSKDITKEPVDNKTTFLASLLPIGNSSMEMHVDLENGKRMVLALDTGNAFFATTHKDVLERVNLWKSGDKPVFMKTAYVASGPVDSWYAQVPKLKIYGVPVESSIWSIIDLPSSSAEHDGTVGYGFLKNFNIVIDYSRRRIQLKNWTGKVDAPQPADIGLSAYNSRRDKKMIVYALSPEGPAEKAGVKIGDEIISVNDVYALNLSNRRLFEMLQGEVGTKVNISLSRKGVVMNKEIERKLLVNALSYK